MINNGIQRNSVCVEPGDQKIRIFLAHGSLFFTVIGRDNPFLLGQTCFIIRLEGNHDKIIL